MSLEFGHRGFDAPFTSRVLGVDDKFLRAAPDLPLRLSHGQLCDQNGELVGLRGTKGSSHTRGPLRRILL